MSPEMMSDALMRVRMRDALAVAPPDTWTTEEHAKILAVLESVAAGRPGTDAVVIPFVIR